MSKNYLQAASQILGERGLPPGRVIRLRVTSGSMRPRLKIGDIIQVKSVDPGALQVGQIVLIRRSQDLVTHRLIRFSTQGWSTKGDRMMQVDPLTTVDSILGWVSAVERDQRVIDLERPLQRAIGKINAYLGFVEDCLFTHIFNNQFTSWVWLRRCARAPFLVLYWILNR